MKGVVDSIIKLLKNVVFTDEQHLRFSQVGRICQRFEGTSGILLSSIPHTKWGKSQLIYSQRIRTEELIVRVSGMLSINWARELIMNIEGSL